MNTASRTLFSQSLRAVLTLIIWLFLPAMVLGEADGTPVLELEKSDLVFYPEESKLVPLTFTTPESGFLPINSDATCSCIEIQDFPLEPFAPGSKQTLKIIMHASSYAGGIDASIRVHGIVQGQDRTIVCTLAGVVSDYVEWGTQSGIIELGSIIESGLPKTLHRTLRRGKNPQRFDALHITAVSNGDIMSVMTTPIDADSWDVAITLARMPRIGTVAGELRMACDEAGKRLPYASFRRVRMTFVGRHSCIPAGLILGSVHAQDSVTKRLQLSSVAGSEAVGVLSITPSDPTRMTARAISNDGKQHLILDFTASGLPGDASGYVDVVYADGSVLRVPYVAAINAIPASHEGEAPKEGF